MNLLDTPMVCNDAHARTLREYFVLLALTVWEEAEGFSGKRPFGNSGWQDEVYDSLAVAGTIKSKLNDEGRPDVSYEEMCRADKMIEEAMKAWAKEINPTIPEAPK